MITDDFYKSPFYRLLTFVTSNFKRIRNMRKLVKLIMLVFVILFVVFPVKRKDTVNTIKVCLLIFQKRLLLLFLN